MKPEEFHVRQDQNHMATTFEFLIRCEAHDIDRADELLARAHALVDSLEEDLSEFRQNGPVYRLNHSSPGKIIPLPEATTALLQKSFSLSMLTKRAFNPLAKSGPDADLHFSNETKTVTRKNALSHLSFGAIGKGFALDQVAALIDEAGFKNYLISAGGSSVIMSGFSADGKGWDWAWSWKRAHAGNALGLHFNHKPGSKIALGISGTHEQGAHLIGPNDSHPTHLKSALVAHHNAAEADALSTALFVSGWNEGAHYLAQADAKAAAVIDAKEIPHWSKGFQALWGSIGSHALGLIVFLFSAHSAFAEGAEDSVDLSSLEGSSFTPYVIERDPRWVILPLFMLAFTLLHLIQNRRKTLKPKVKETT